VELGGATQQVIAQNASSAGGKSVPGAIRGFTYSPDAQWVYLSGGNCNYNAILYRLPVANPQALERLSPTGMDECFELVNHWPSLSPDGARLAYENQTWNQSGYSVRVMTISTKAITEIVAGGQRPRWSPAGDLIAYWADKQIRVVRPDGTGARVVSPAGYAYVPGVQWSPDGKWILARFEPRQGWAGTTVALLNVGTGLEIPLTWTTSYNGVALPAWKPVP
jgi:Tol biopolymer transport system component